MSPTTLKPLTLHSHPGPNPWKPALLLRALSLPHQSIHYTTPQLKEPAFLALNRNGLAPVLEDPNTGLVLAESGAIIDYILEQYDTDHILSFGEDQLKEKYLMKQWLQFQTTTHGPLLQLVFRYTLFVPDPIAREDGVKRFRHVLDVLEHELSADGGKKWLVGGKCTAADLSYLSFHGRIGAILGNDAPDMGIEYPRVDAWVGRMREREDVRSVTGEQEEVFGRLAPKPKGAAK